jgi:hypothetical protein
VSIYTVLYYILLYRISCQIRYIRGITTRFQNIIVPPDISEPIYLKLRMLQCLFLVVGGAAILEIITECLFAFSKINFLAVILLHKIPWWILLLSLAYVFRPREFTSFFQLLPIDHLQASLRLGEVDGRYIYYQLTNKIFIMFFLLYRIEQSGFPLLCLILLLPRQIQWKLNCLHY